jgi:probable F420-dependent oxidoreductase
VRPGITVPFGGVPLSDHRAWFEEIAALGYTDVWSNEALAHDGFTALALAAAWTPTLRLGTAIIPASTRGPALLAQTTAAMCDAAPGRFALGIGASSPVIVEQWNGVPFEHPYERTRDVLRFLRAALAGDKVNERYETFSVEGFRLGVAPKEPPPILVAALRRRMLELAGREADGAILNWLSPDDVARVAPIVGDKEIVARVFVVPSDDFDTVRAVAARQVTAYLTVPVYRKFHEWLGRGPALAAMWDAWASGDRRRAVELVPDAVIDELFLWGSPARMRARLARYVDNGVTTTAPAILAEGDALRAGVRALAPAAAG